MIDNKKMCRLRDVYRAIAQVEAQMEQRFGLNLNEAMVLCNLNAEENLTAGMIAERLGLAQSNASKVICSLENKHLLKRKIDKHDKRVVHYALTPQGTDKIKNADCDSLEFPPILEDIFSKSE